MTARTDGVSTGEAGSGPATGATSPTGSGAGLGYPGSGASPGGNRPGGAGGSDPGRRGQTGATAGPGRTGIAVATGHRTPPVDADRLLFGRLRVRLRVYARFTRIYT